MFSSSFITFWQVCYKGASSTSGPLWDTMFQETGLTVKVQNLLKFAMINVRDPLGVKGMWDSSIDTSNLGVRLTAPKADGILLLIPSEGLISFIAEESDCTSTGDGAENPMTFMAEQMYVSTNPQPYAAGASNAYFALQSSNLDKVIGKFGVMNDNMYQVCFSPVGIDQFFATGISFRLQIALTQAIVNGVRPNFGLRVALPQSRKSLLSFEGVPTNLPPEHMTVMKSYSFIKVGGDCLLESDNGAAQSSNVSGHMLSGAVHPSDFDVPVLETDRMQQQEPGLYQICYRLDETNGVLFSDTGLTIDVQASLMRLQVNFIPKIRSVIPRVENNEIFFCTDENCTNLELGGSSPSATLSFILPDQECEDVVNSNSPAATTGRSGHIETVNGRLRSTGNEIFASLDSSLSPGGTLYVGIYQVCYGVTQSTSSNPIFLSTGLSLDVQEYFTQLVVSGATPGFGLRAAIPRSPGITLDMAFGSPEFGGVSDQVSLIRNALECDDPEHNPELADEFSSGHLSSSGVSKILAGTQGVTSLQNGIYQACFKGRDGKFKTTGVSVTLQTWASGFISLPERPLSLRTTVTKSQGNRLRFFSDGTGQREPTRASLILGSGSCIEVHEPDGSNRNVVGPVTSGHLPVTASDTSEGEFNVLIPSEIEQSDVLAELIYQFCVEVQGEWKSTGLSVVVEWSSADDAPTTDFDFVTSQESSILAGSSSAVHVLMKTKHILPPGGILRVSGLGGSQTKDSPFLDVEGNTVEEVTMEMVCAGNWSCEVTTDTDYVETGKILMQADMTIEVVCTDLDSVCKQCREGTTDCSEGIRSAAISNADTRRDFTSSISRGPWKGCLKKCQETRQIIAGHDILDIATKNGKPFTITLQTSKETNFYTCKHNESPVSLKAYVKINMLISKLSQHLLIGSFSSNSGRLAVPNVPFDKNEYIHITIILMNSNRETRPRIPSASIVATRSDGMAVNKMNALIRPKFRLGILMADQNPQFVSASLEMSNKFTGEINRFLLRLKTNLPAVIPKELVITIAGLVGSNEDDNAQLPLLDPSYVEIKTFDCVGGKHCLVDVDAKPSTKGATFRRAALDIDILCSDFGSYPSKYIESISACSQMAGQTSCPPLEKLVLDERDYSRGPWQECSGCSTSTRRVIRGYDLSKIIDNFDTFLLKRFALEVYASKDVSDLKCPYTPGSTSVLAVKAILTVRIEYFRAAARWTKSTGTLTVSASNAPDISKCGSSDPLSCLPDVAFSFELKNPNYATSGPVNPQVSARGGGLVFSPVTLPATFEIVGPKTQFEVTEAFIKESTRIKGNIFSTEKLGLNTLTLRIKVDRPLPAGTLITVGGLQGTQTPSKPCNSVEEPTCGTNDCIYSSANQMCQNGLQLKNHALGSSIGASWDQATGTLRFMVMKSFAQIEELEFSFQVWNAASMQAAKVATVSGAGLGFVIRSTPVEGTVLSSDLDQESTRSTQPVAESAIIEENNKIELEANHLTATMKFNVPLAAGSEIRITGLDQTYMPPTEGQSWYGDALPLVEMLNVKALSGHEIETVGQYASSRNYHMPWICKNDGWGVEHVRFHKDGTSPLECQFQREAPGAGGILPSNCATFYQKSWCVTQREYSLVTFLDECIRPHEDISFRVAINNGRIPTVAPSVPPALHVEGGSVTISSLFTPSSLYPSLQKTCKGSFSCKASFVQDERFLDQQRRYLPAFAVLRKATLSIDLACSSFSDPAQFLQRISMCPVPDCATLFGAAYEWNQEENECCSSIACITTVCADPIPIPPGQVKAFEVGPWPGCQGNCSNFRVVMDQYDVMPFVCAGQAKCSKPKSFRLFLSATGAADQYACSGQGPKSVFVFAKVSLQLEVFFDGAAFASEPARLDNVRITQTTDTKQALSKFTVIVDSMVTFPINSVVVITGLTGSMTSDNADITIAHPACSIGSMVDEDIRVPCAYSSDCDLISWNSKKGELQVKTLRAIASVGDNLHFSFVLRNPRVERNPRIPELTVKLGGSTGISLTKQSSTGIMSSSEESKIIEGNFVESTQVRLGLNRITVSFRVNFHLLRGNNVTINGLVNSETVSTDGMPINIDNSSVMGCFKQQEGSLLVKLPNFYAPGETIVLSFELRNPRHPQINRKITLEMSSASGSEDEPIVLELSSNGFKSSEVLGLSQALLKQDHAIADQLNRLECFFAASMELPMGSTIMLSGLIGSQTGSNIEFPISISIEDGSRTTVSQKSAEWDSSRGVLSFALPSRLPVGTLFRFSFHLLNPKMKGPSRAARLSVNDESAHVAMCEVGDVLDASDSARFIIAKMGESSRETSAQSTVTMILQLNIDLKPSMHEIQVSGMLLPNEESLTVDAKDFDASIPSGSQTLVLTPKTHLFHNESYVFTCILTNSGQGTAARVVSVALHNTLTGVKEIAPTAVEGSVRSSSLTGNIVSLTINESTKAQGAINRLKVQFAFDFYMSYGTSITLTGLTGTLTSTATLELHGEDSQLFREPSQSAPTTGTWEQGTGTLSFSIKQRTIIDAARDIVVEFDLVNPAAVREESVISLAVPAHIAEAKTFATRVLEANQAPSFVSALVSENSQVAGTWNTITISFSVNTELHANSQITITGLVNATIQQGSVSPAAVAVMDDFSNGALIVTLVQLVPASKTETFGFILRNPQEVRAARVLSISARTVVSGSTILFEERPMEGTILSGSEPLRFVLTEMSETTRIQGDRNTLSITLRANCPLASNSEITITNLRGTQTADTGCVVVEGSPKINRCGDWEKDSGTMILTVGSLPFEAFENIEFSFELTNSATGQDGVVPKVYASNGVRATALVPGAVEWHDGVEIWRGDQVPDTVVGTVLSASDARVWTSAIVEETVKLTNSPNSIFIEMKANTDLPVGSKITISGLTGSSEPDTARFRVEGKHGSDTTLGTWTKLSGELSFALSRNIPQDEGFSIKLTLRNAPEPQTAVRPVLSLSYCNLESGGTCFEGWKIAPRRTDVRSTGDICCLSADDKPRFIIATVRETSNVKGTLNVLQFWFKTNVPMTTGTKLTISGLAGTESPDDKYLVLMNSTYLSANWRRAGYLEFEVHEEMYYCDCIDACDQNSISVSVQLRNPKQEKPKPAIEVSLNREGVYKIEKTAVSGSALRAQLDNSLFASVSESSKVSGELNNITIRMIVDSDLDICFAKWQDQSDEWISPHQTLALYAAGPDDTVASSLAKLFDGLVDTSASIAQNHGAGQTAEIYFDFKQVFRLEAISVTGTMPRSSVKTLKFQFANSLDAPDVEWKTATMMTIGTGNSPKTSALFDYYSQYWRIQLINNDNPILFPSSTTLSEVKFYGCPDSETTTIKVSNLTKATRSVQLYNVKAGRGSLRSYGTQIGDEISVKVKKSIRAFEDISFTLESSNAPRAQPAKLASVSVGASLFQIPRTFAYGNMLASDEDALFVTKEITEDNNLQSDYNTLKVVLRANVELKQGRHIRIAFGNEHLQNNLDRNRAVSEGGASCLSGNGDMIEHPCIMDNRILSNSAWYIGTDSEPLGYKDQKPSFIMFLKETVPKLEEIRLTMIVKNPSRMQETGLVPEIMASGIKRSPMTGSIMRATQAGPSFTTRIVHHSSDMLSGENTITISLKPGPGATLPVGTTISICGLRGTDKDAGTAAAFPKDKTFLSRSTGASASEFGLASNYQLIKRPLLPYYRTVSEYEGELQACIEFKTEGGEWQAGNIASVSFSFKNPGILLESSNVPQLTVVASQKITIALPLCKVMNAIENNLCSVPSDALWTRRKPGFLSLSLGQSNRAVSQPSTFTVTLVPNIIVAAESKLTISGLQGLSADLIDIKDVPDGSMPIAHLVTVGSWSHSTGVLELEATGPWNRADLSEIQFQFTVTLPSSTREDANVTLCPTFAVPDTGLKDISSGAVALPSSNCQLPLGYMHADEDVQFLVKSISESSDVENQDSIIEVELTSNFIMLPGTTLTLTGLTGSQTADDMSLPILSSYISGDSISESALEWQKKTGMLKVELTKKVPVRPGRFKLSFVLQNPKKAERESNPANPHLIVMNVGATDFPNVALDGAVLRSPSTARITSLRLHEQTQVRNQMNTLNVTFTSNVGISQGGIVNLAGLIGRDQDQYQCHSTGTDVNVTYDLPAVKIQFETSSGSFVEVTSSRNSVTVNEQRCLQVDSIVQVSVPFFVKAGELLSFTFRVANWPQQLAGCQPSVSYTGCRARLNPSGDLSCPSMDGDSCSCLSSDTTFVPPRSSDHIILSSRDSPMIWQALVGESTGVLSQPNTITVTLTMNFELTPGASITINGLQNSQTPNALALPISGKSAAQFGAAGRWQMGEGLLKLTAKGFVDVNQTVVFNFVIVNKGKQDQARCKNGAHFCSGVGGYNEGKACPMWAEGQICSGRCTKGLPFCSKNSLNGDCSSYTSDDLKDSAKAKEADALCPGGVCFPPNNGYQCPSGTLVNVTAKTKEAGLLIDPSVNKFRMIYMGQSQIITGQACTGTNVVCEGQTVCKAPNEGAVCTQHNQCEGAFDPSIQNTKANFFARAGNQRCVRTPRIPDIRVDVMAARANITYTKMQGTIIGVSSPQPPEFTTRVLSESNMIAGASNVLTVSLATNFRLYEVERTNVTLIGIPLHRYGLGGRIPLLPANAQIETQHVDCTMWKSVVTCEKIGRDIDTDVSNFVLTAAVTIDVQCNSESIRILSLREGDGNQSLPVGSYRSSPCLDCTSTRCPLIDNFDVRNRILTSGGQGFKLRVFTNIEDQSSWQFFASLVYRETREYGQYEASKMRLVVNGQNAASLKRNDRTLLLEIPLNNAAAPQVAPSVTVLGESGLVKRIGICDDEIEAGCMAADVPSTVRAIMTGTVLTSAAEGPMRYVSIQETSTVQGVENVLTVEVEIQNDDGQFINIPANSRITVSGLLGSQTPSTDQLLVSGYRMDQAGTWDQERGVLLVKVNSMPHSSVPSALRFSFALRNPRAAQAAQTPWVVVSSAVSSHGGPSAQVKCITHPGCAGVLAAADAPSFTSIQVYEKTRYANQKNTLSFFLEANVPLQRQGTKIRVRANLPPASGHLALARSPGTSRRKERCAGMNGCVLGHNQAPVLGTIVTRMYTDLEVACTDENRNSRTFEKLIEGLEIHAVRFCGQPINVKYRSPCSDVVKHWAVLSDFDVTPCLGDTSMLVHVVGQGLLNVTSVLNVDYVFDTSSQLVFANQAFEITVVTNHSTAAFESTATASQKLHRFAFSFHVQNSPVRQNSEKPIVQIVSTEGAILAEAPANSLGGGIGGSGVVFCDGVDVADNQMALPVQNADLGVDGSKAFRLYHEIAQDGVAECVSVIQPENPNNFLMKLTIEEYDVNEAAEMVEIFNGDSPTSPRMGILYKKTQAFRLDSRYFLASREVFVEECAVALRFSARRNLLAGQQQLLGYSRGHMGFAVSYKLVDPKKMDHFIAPLGFSDMVDDITEASIQLKLRKVFAAIMSIMYPSVVFDEASAARRSKAGFASGRRAGTSTASIRVLCNSPTDATSLADSFSTAINADSVSVGMNAVGIPGRVALTGPVRVYRCGIELECVPTPPRVIPEETPPPVPPEGTPKPFPLIQVIQLSVGIIIGPLIVGLCVLAVFCHMKMKLHKELTAKRKQAIEAFNEWMEEKIDDLTRMSGSDLGALASKHELVSGNWTEKEVQDMIPEIALYLYRTKRGCGNKPDGVYKYVPPKMYEEGAKFKPQQHQEEAGVGTEPSKEAVEGVQTAEVTANLEFKQGESAAEHAEAENGEGEEGSEKKRGKKRTEAKEEHKVLWIKRASKDKAETQEEVAV